MIGYQQAYHPRFSMAQGPAAIPVSPPAGPAAKATASALTVAQREMGIALGVAETLFGGVATLVGVRVGLKDEGIFSLMGWGVAVGGAVFTLINLLGTLATVESKS